MQALTFTKKALNTLLKLLNHGYSNKEIQLMLASMSKNALGTKFSRLCEMISTVPGIEKHFNKFK